MRENPAHAVTDERVVRELIAENPWATIVSSSPQHGLVASHYPVLLDEQAEGLAVLTHVGRPDEQLHGLGETEVLLIVAGPHGYVSPSWYSELPAPAPTWNFAVAHCYGVPEVLDEEQNLQVLTRLVAHFERAVEQPVLLDQEIGARIARGTVGLRVPIDHFVCKVKMSQDKDRQSREQVLAALGGDGPYSDAELAAYMRRALGGRRGYPPHAAD